MTLLLDPEIRLALSRERIRLALRALDAHKASSNPTSPSSSTASPSPFASVLSALLGGGWREVLQSEPLVSARARLATLAQRHPLGLVLAALAAGGVLALAKPWRWFSVPPLLAAILPQMLGSLAAQVPPATWISALDALLERGSAPTAQASKVAAAPE